MFSHGDSNAVHTREQRPAGHLSPNDQHQGQRHPRHRYDEGGPTDDAVLLAHKSQAQKIKELVKKLAEDGRLKKLV